MYRKNPKFKCHNSHTSLGNTLRRESIKTVYLIFVATVFSHSFQTKINHTAHRQINTSQKNLWSIDNDFCIKSLHLRYFYFFFWEQATHFVTAVHSATTTFSENWVERPVRRWSCWSLDHRSRRDRKHPQVYSQHDIS